jgi:CRP-like cAMP-binding protein
MKNHLVNYLQQFKEISPEDAAIITHAFERKVYKQGESLVRAGDVVEELYFINKGILKITIQREITYYFMKEHQFMSFLYSLYTNAPVEQSLFAVFDTEVLSVNKEQLFLLFDRLPYFKTLLDEIAHLSMVEMINVKNAYLGCDSSERYLLFLERQPEIALKVPQIDIASYLGITPQSLSRIRRNIRSAR